MNRKSDQYASGSPANRIRSVPIADAWLPGLGDATLADRGPWSEFTPRQKRVWTLKVILLAALALTVVANPSSAVRDGLVWGAFFYVLFRRRKTLFSKKPDHLSLALLVYVGTVMASVIYSAHRYWSVRDAWKFLYVLVMVFAAWHLFKNRAFLFGFLQLLIASLLVVCICDVTTYLVGLGRLWQWGERWVEGLYYGHPNPSSAIVMLLMPLSVFLLWTSRNVWLKAMHGCFIVLGLFLMFVMASRTAQVALFGMVVCGAILVRPRRRKVVALVGVGVFLVTAFLNIRAINPRFLDETFGSLTFRDENWRNLTTLIAKRPLFGYGYGRSNYQTVYHRSFPGSVIRYWHAHSLVLQTAFETGIVGLAAMAWLWAVMAWRLLRGYLTSWGAFGSLCGALLVSFLGISIYCLAEVPDGFLRSLSWLLVAMTGALTGGMKPNEEARSGVDAGQGPATWVS